MHVSGIKQIIERALVSYSGVTTSAGGAGGSTLVDSNLSIDYDGQAVLITSGSYTGQARDIDGDTSSGTVTPSSNFGGVIVAGTTFLILSGIPAMAEFDDLEANLGAFTSAQNLKAILGDLSSTKRLGQILGLDETDTLKAILGAFTAAQNLKAILGDLSSTKNLGGILGAFTTAQNLKAILGDLTATKNLGGILGDFSTANNLKALLGAFTTTNTLKAILGGYTSAASLKDAIDAITAAGPTNVQMEAARDAIKNLVDSAEAAGPYSYLNAGVEQTVVEDTAVTRRRIFLEFSNRNMTLAGTFIIYRKVDGTNYDIWATIAATVAAGDDRCWDAEFTTNQAWKLTYEESADEGADRDIDYNVITQVIE